MVTILLNLDSHSKREAAEIINSIFEDKKLYIEDHCEKNIFDLTPRLQAGYSADRDTLILTSSDDFLRMISNAMAIEDRKNMISYLGESSWDDEKFQYLLDSNHQNIITSYRLGEQIHLDSRVKDSPLSLRMGALKQDISKARVYMHDSLFIFLNINLMKWSDAPCQKGRNASGMTSEEVNQLAYMAGQSSKNQYFILYGFDSPEQDPLNLSAHTAAQIIWYYFYGSTDKKQPWPIPNNQFQDFSIESKMMDENLLFRKDQLTNQWFHKIPFPMPHGLEDFEWIASSLEEYQAAANEDIPQRLMTVYERFHEISEDTDQ